MSQSPSADQLKPAVGQLLGIAKTVERDDLIDRIKAAAIRATRSDTVVCVVGEFKQGKSSLVNSLVRRNVCPVDDDLATSVITMLHHGDPAGAIVRSKENGKPVAEAIDVDDVASFASEQGNPGNEKGVDRVDITLPAAILEGGLTLVDTPGMGGLGGGHAAATLSFLPFADGLILVSDTSSELTAPEVDFLKKAVELCPTVMLAATKTDLYSEFERIVGYDTDHLNKQGLTIPIVPVSSLLRDAALRAKNRELNLESGFPKLLDVLQKQVVGPAKSSATRRAVGELKGVARLLRTGLEEELRVLDDPEAREEAVAELGRAGAKLEQLRGPGARWSTVLSDRITDLQTAVNHRYRGEMRTIGREMDERCEELTRGSDWEELTRDAQTRVSESTAKAFSTVQQTWGEVHGELAQLLGAEDVILFDQSRNDRERSDLNDFWAGTESVTKDENSGLAGFRSVLGIGQTYGSSQYLFSNISGVSKFGVSLGALAAGPVLAGGFVVMGGLKVFDDRKKKLATRKQKLRSQIRSFMDNVQFEMGDEIASMVREAQRSMRDEFVARIGELQTTYAETVQRLQADAKRGEQELADRRQQLVHSLKALDTVDASLEQAVA